MVVDNLLSVARLRMRPLVWFDFDDDDDFGEVFKLL